MGAGDTAYDKRCKSPSGLKDSLSFAARRSTLQGSGGGTLNNDSLFNNDDLNLSRDKAKEQQRAVQMKNKNSCSANVSLDRIKTTSQIVNVPTIHSTLVYNSVAGLQRHDSGNETIAMKLRRRLMANTVSGGLTKPVFKDRSIAAKNLSPYTVVKKQAFLQSEYQ